MSSIEPEVPAEVENSHHRGIRITVNNQFVVVRHEMSGEEIKTAAIAQGVPIQLDFELSEVLPDGKQRPIGNDKHVHVKNGDEFWAIPGDDNS